MKFYNVIGQITHTILEKEINSPTYHCKRVDRGHLERYGKLRAIWDAIRKIIGHVIVVLMTLFSHYRQKQFHPSLQSSLLPSSFFPIMKVISS